MSRVPSNFRSATNASSSTSRRSPSKVVASIGSSGPGVAVSGSGPGSDRATPSSRVRSFSNRSRSRSVSSGPIYSNGDSCSSVGASSAAASASAISASERIAMSWSDSIFRSVTRMMSEKRSSKKNGVMMPHRW